MKVLINSNFGGFNLTDEFRMYAGIQYQSDWNLERHDPKLIQKIEEFGLEKAAGPYSVLEIVEVPDGCGYSIHEYDGSESISETWITVTQAELKNGLSAEKLALASKVSCIRIDQ